LRYFKLQLRGKTKNKRAREEKKEAKESKTVIKVKKTLRVTEKRDVYLEWKEKGKKYK
jgi:hypothetical protein